MAMPTPQRDQSYKLLIVGDKGVGKTAFSSVISNLYPGKLTIDNLGLDIKTKEINFNGKRIELTIYDSSSAEDHRDIIKYSCAYVHGIFIIYDATNRESFENLNNWLDEINNHGGKHVIKLIIGNKCDLAGEKEVSFDRAEEYGIKSNISIFEVSARDLTNVALAFMHMVLKIQFNLTSTINRRLGQYRERIDLVFVHYVFGIGSYVAKQNVNDQGLHDNTEDEQLSTEAEENACVTHIDSVDEGEIELAQISLLESQMIEEKAKQLNDICFSQTISIYVQNDN
ncbi:unnamed protein product [Adineta steineri]|uniref:Uncharacterized protein n=1 Tax=Adineta steineri TaxID=433720 RepID=A0A819BWM8_9BILA|nr:unnamed protein product [Adineta steineri]CAF1287522.1 unnamed protein product [Adineta steineri]CAF3810657.1 unnamed protein product [Adineta steineri]CAF4073773.1 unnamed protein product [Adineta steineri]